MDELSYQYEILYRHIAQGITNGDWKPGDQLPTEMQLADQFGVSRITSKRALNLLADQGLVVRKRGLGTFVSQSLQPGRFMASARLKMAASKNGQRRIGLIMEDLGESYAMSLFYALDQLASQRGFQICLGVSYGQQAVERKSLHQLLALDVEGLLVMPAHGTYYDTDLLRLVLDHFPVVLLDRPLLGIPAPCVCSRHEEGASMLTQHLQSRGHRRIMYLTSEVSEAISLEDRYQGYKKAMEGAGLTAALPVVVPQVAQFAYPAHPQDRGQPATQEFLMNWLNAHQEVSAVVCAEYGIARLVHAAARQLGRDDPKDLSICCFDEKYGYLGEYFFTHVKQDETAIAHSALDILESMLANKNMRRQIRQIPVELMEGKST
ncbi:MAG: GntR family transcriptional regulator [Clostridiales bacterium]|nr:GntR family transcriptional regulator [Clostridiales bacterium]